MNVSTLNLALLIKRHYTHGRVIEYLKRKYDLSDADAEFELVRAGVQFPEKLAEHVLKDSADR